HARGDSERAQGRFEAAAQHAQRVGAVLEEATYLTGVAAAASDRGSFGVALEAAERSALLFEQLGKSRAAARAALARAAVFSCLGLVLETKQAVEETESRAREASDVTCLGYAHLAMADVLPSGSHEARDHAERAAQLLGKDNPRDRLRTATRLLQNGLPVDLVELDGLARGGAMPPTSGAVERSVPVDARLEWWGVRAERCLELEPERGADVVTELEILATEQAPCLVRGRALTAGVALALALGDTDGARRLSAGASVAARELRRLAPPELMRAVEGLSWVALAQGPGKTEFLPEQLEDVERLVLALGKRDRLRPLFDQVLDALVLWTGVERGLLLLRAPGGRLTPRAARNLAKSDLSGAQLQLSYSLAARALEQQQPVVAIDAAGELPALHASVHALKLRSVLAVPLIARGHTFGVVYLDDRERRGAFGGRELAWVKLVATLAAVAIADARDQLLLRRAMRRAQRAETKVSERLAQREVELEVAARELARTRGIRETRYAYEAIVGESPALCRMLDLVDRVTASDVSVLLVGESGVGKELIARAIHDNGARGKQPFVGENCAAIPEGLLESTLFGHVRGAFTGAQRPRAGLFEAASGGTLFLDEIGEMSLSMQSKLLRVLQDGEVRPVGSERAHKVDVRVIAATHRDLLQMVEQGAFREDLYYRLNVISIQVPPLRERVGDIERLVHHFVRVHAPERRVRVTPEAFAVLGRYAWPGNIRQLENEVQRFLVIGDDVIDPGHLSTAVQGETQRAVPQELGLNVRRHVDALETELVLSALEKTGGNQTRAAELLGLSRFGLQKMMKRLEITARRPALRRLSSRLSDAG
ncbi:MAG TPA: sigma 54-interacting transcriptional regulator, partial [Polyangiaceae bacterium]|nr:sigma 54-interacting transcriptional regulator [Polyangiaceae bacterium]